MTACFENYLELRDAYKNKNDLQILPVTKGHSKEKILQFIEESKSNVHEFGENYYEELKEKYDYFSKNHKDIKINWHFMGRLQSRKISSLMEISSYFHGVCRDKELQAISQQIKNQKANLFKGFYVQVNISAEDSKGGLPLEEVPQFLNSIVHYKLEEKFLGFMGMATPLEVSSQDQVKSEFLSLKNLRDKLNPNLKLNIGMSGDYALAIEAGTNLIRIGTRIFGAR